MRHRITHIFDSIESIDLNSLAITRNSISTRNPIKSAKEEKITFNIDELPLELFRLVAVSQELHVRWVTEKSYKKTRPFTSILSPGLHVFYTPKRGSKSLASLCSLLKKAFGGIDCVHPGHSFTALPANQFFNHTSYQYYTLMPSISNFTDYLRYTACSQFPIDLSQRCAKQVADFTTAAYIDVCFTKSNSLIISSFRPVDTQLFSASIPKDISLKTRYEIGLLAPEPLQESETLSYEGFLFVAGEDSKPKPTRLSFQSRHRYSKVNFQSNFLKPSGIHPSLEIKVSDVAHPIQNQECGLFVYLTFPRNIFLDKYQFLDALFLADKNISSLAFIHDTVDLEAPEYTIESWGSSALIKLATPVSKPSPNFEWTAHIPTHLRYLLPASNSSGFREIEMPYPVVFWACTPEEHVDLSNNPFDRTRLGYDHFFDPITVFYHLNPNSSREDGRLINRLQVPVLNLDQTSWVESLTLWAIGFGFIWVCWCLLKVAMRTGYMSGKEKAYNKKKKAL
ncbi:Protein pbn1 [Erysiphe neolycopersici]|uniref:Protein PBN1 n=1 Tax=Erysiphe neolycopersici TaxID=212602 RepID=A0A420HEU3_9PEZI|nr:Protein pbn1 [Erysiphe neolycopersici]